MKLRSFGRCFIYRSLFIQVYFISDKLERNNEIKVKKLEISC
jgi:hypothetical protein